MRRRLAGEQEESKERKANVAQRSICHRAKNVRRRNTKKERKNRYGAIILVSLFSLYLSVFLV